MAEALVAVGLAANIFQFIDVGSRYVSTLWKIYVSARQGPTELLDVQTITRDLKNVLRDLRTSDESSVSLDSNESGLQRLVQSCEALAGELLDSLRKVQVPEKSRKRDAVTVTFRVMRQEEDLKSMQVRMDRFRQELVLHLLNLIRYVLRGI